MRRPLIPDAPSTGIHRFRSDAVALAILIVSMLVVIWHRSVNDNWLSEYDISSFFVPWFGMIGDRLRDFDIPGWTRYFSSGTPVAGDPSSGWMYLPVMIAFSTLSITAAFKAMILIQLLVGGISTYVLSRVLGFGVLAAMVSAVTFSFGPFLYGQTHFATIAAQVTAWIPLALLGIELSLRTTRRRHTLAAWSVSGIAISQIAAAWMGQGLVNGLLIIGAWVVYRTLIAPPLPGIALRARFVQMVTTGPAVLIVGLALGAAGILPRLAVNAQSSIAGGDYSGLWRGDYEEARHSVETLIGQLLSDAVVNKPIGYSGLVIVLCLLAPILGGRRLAIPFFAVVLVIACILTLEDTIVHRLFYLIPTFETIHHHSPRRILWVISLAPAMLAGAAVQSILDNRYRNLRPAIVWIPFGLLLFVGESIEGPTVAISNWVYIGAGLATLLASVALLAPRVPVPSLSGSMPRLALAAMIVVAFMIPNGKDMIESPEEIPSSVLPVTLLGRDPDTQTVIDAYVSRTDPGGAGEFLQAQRDKQPPFRYVGYAGRGFRYLPDQSYSSRRMEPGVVSVLSNGRASRLGLEHIQGYNPTHLRYYNEYVDMMNGTIQDYHWLDAFPPALSGSQLLDMLNVRYIVVDLAIPQDREDVRAITAERPEVFRNARVAVFENPGAFPRAWIVHDVRLNNDGEGLALLANRSVNGRQTAFVDGPLPVVAPPNRPADDSVAVIESKADALTVQARADAAGLVVFSETYEEGWRAYVDGERVDILRANHALRGVPIPAGTHTIEMRYEPTSLTVGLWTSGVAGMAVLIVFGMVVEDVVRRGWGAAGRHGTGGRAGRSRTVRSSLTRRAPGRNRDGPG